MHPSPLAASGEPDEDTQKKKSRIEMANDGNGLDGRTSAKKVRKEVELMLKFLFTAVDSNLERHLHSKIHSQSPWSLSHRNNLYHGVKWNSKMDAGWSISA